MSRLIVEKWDNLNHSLVVFRHVHGKTACFYLRAAAAVAVIGVGVYAAKKLLAIRRKRHRLAKSNAKKDVVFLHQFPRAYTVPSMSPFCIKLETYFRMANISYETDFDDFFGPKGKTPWITLNGEDIEDSQLIVERLNSKFGIDLDSRLTEEEKAVAHAFRIMTENFLFWALALHRYSYDKEHKYLKQISVPSPAKRIIAPIMNKKIRKTTWFHGIGRHSPKEVTDMAVRDLKSLSSYLGNKPFFCGNEPSEVDCALFGMLAIVLWSFPDTIFEKLLNDELPNLKQYCIRMKEKFWPDWNACLKQKK